MLSVKANESRVKTQNEKGAILKDFIVSERNAGTDFACVAEAVGIVIAYEAALPSSPVSNVTEYINNTSLDGFRAVMEANEQTVFDFKLVIARATYHYRRRYTFAYNLDGVILENGSQNSKVWDKPGIVSTVTRLRKEYGF